MEPRMCKETFIDVQNLFDETGETFSKGPNPWLYSAGPDWFDKEMIDDIMAEPTFKMMQHENALGSTCDIYNYRVRIHNADANFCHCIRFIDKDFPLLLTKYTRYDTPDLTKEDLIWNFEIREFMFLKANHIKESSIQEALIYADESVQASLWKGTLNFTDLDRPFFISGAKYRLMKEYNPDITFNKIKNEAYTIKFHSVTPRRDWITGCAFPYLYMITDSVSQIKILDSTVFNIPDFRVYEPDFLDINYYTRDALVEELKKKNDKQ